MSSGDMNDLLPCPRCGECVTLQMQDAEIQRLRKLEQRRNRLFLINPAPTAITLALSICIRCGTVYDPRARRTAAQNAIEIEGLRAKLESPLERLARAAEPDMLIEFEGIE